MILTYITYKFRKQLSNSCCLTLKHWYGGIYRGRLCSWAAETPQFVCASCYGQHWLSFQSVRSDNKLPITIVILICCFPILIVMWSCSTIADCSTNYAQIYPAINEHIYWLLWTWGIIKDEVFWINLLSWLRLFLSEN